jgi:iron complex outermembrane receptor protein
MMKTPLNKIFHILTLMLLIGHISLAQTSASKVTGTLSDDKGEPIGFATVKLLKAGDSTLVKGTLSNEAGQYLFENIADGEYLIKTTALNYANKSSSIFVISTAKQAIKVPTLALQIASNSLAVVTISASKPVIERKSDRTIMNVENSILATGNSALEILARAPGVTIDKDDNISLNGKGGVNVMINDKMTYLSAAQLSTLLRSTDGNTIKSIELMTNPSAKYDASGNAGIINIKLKKNNQSGTNGSFTLGAGYGKHARENGTISLNHKQGNLNVFSSFSHSDSKNEFRLRQQKIVTDTSNNKTYFNQQSEAERVSHNNSYRLGADLGTGRQNTIGFLINGYFNTAKSNGNSLTDIGQTPHLITSSQDQVSKKAITNKNLSLNLNDNLKLDTLGQQLGIDLDYSRFNSRFENEYNTDFYLPNGSVSGSPIALRQQTPSLIKIRTAKIDYSLPLAKNTKVEAGMKYSSVRTDNNLEAQRLENGNFMNDTTLTNRFVYDEKIAATYLNVTYTFNKTTLQAGLRAEHTSSDGNLINSENEVKRSYIDFFPSIFINQKIDEKNVVGLSYSRRIDRPGYEELNPFVYYIDQYSYSKGNPFLNPQYTNKIEVNYTYDHNLNVGVGYSRTNNYLTNLPLTNPLTNVTVYTTLNLQRQNYYNVSISSPYTINKWWNGNINAVAYYSGFKSESLLGGRYDRGQVSAHIQTTQYLQVAKDYRAEIMANYDSPFLYGTYHYQHTIYGDVGISHSFASKKANLKLSVTDLFNTNRAMMTSKFQSNDINIYQKSESRITRLTFAYNIGNNALKILHHESGAGDEKSRVGG